MVGFILGLVFGFYLFGAWFGKTEKGWMFDWPYRWVRAWLDAVR